MQIPRDVSLRPKADLRSRLIARSFHEGRDEQRLGMSRKCGARCMCFVVTRV
jgi:hypothetical protein